MAAWSASRLQSLSNLDIRNTVPELQSDFRALWDEIEQAPEDTVREEAHENLVQALFNSPLPASDHITADPVDELSPGGILEVTRRPTTVATSSHPSPPGSHGQSDTSQAVASTGIAATDDIANTQSREQPAVRHGSVAATAPVVAHHDAQDLSDPIEMESFRRIRQSDTSSDNPT
ncbi:hypothetical protein BGW80DRAFT_1310516 [Lactifluus volemus]|nr:hypothetical protein BGW80DRAFT_1310516 [Lactifluus volemus]